MIRIDKQVTSYYRTGTSKRMLKFFSWFTIVLFYSYILLVILNLRHNNISSEKHNTDEFFYLRQQTLDFISLFTAIAFMSFFYVTYHICFILIFPSLLNTDLCIIGLIISTTVILITNEVKITHPESCQCNRSVPSTATCGPLAALCPILSPWLLFKTSPQKKISAKRSFF